MSTQADQNPFLPPGPDTIAYAGRTHAEMLALRAVDFAELPFAVRLDQLIEALPQMRTSDLMAFLLRTEDVLDAFTGDAPLAARNREQAGLMVAVAMAHCAAELDRRIPPRKVG